MIEHNTLFQYRLRILLRRIDCRADLRHGVDGPDRSLQRKGAAGRKLVIRESLVRDGNRFVIGDEIDIRSLQPLAVTRFAPDAAACPGAGTDLDVNALIHRADRLGGIRLGVQVRVRPGAERHRDRLQLQTVTALCAHITGERHTARVRIGHGVARIAAVENIAVIEILGLNF